jgi:arylamine N-acetyltransferase
MPAYKSTSGSYNYDVDIPSYLRRMLYSGPLDVSAETLRELHKAHLLTIPFENLDNHVGRRIVLDEEKVIRKLVEERRGGVCYELNGAFCGLLREIGFDVSMLAAGVARDEGGFDPPFDHLTLMVNLDQRWLADVGFGDSFREPLLLDERGERRVSVDGSRRAFNPAPARERRVEAAVPVYSRAVPLFGVLGNVHISSNVTRIDLYATESVLSRNKRRKNHSH